MSLLRDTEIPLMIAQSFKIAPSEYLRCVNIRLGFWEEQKELYYTPNIIMYT